MAAPRKYPDELRERAIRLVLDGKADPANTGRNVLRRVGEQLGINAETLRGWVKQAEIDAGGRPGTTTDHTARLAELQSSTRPTTPPRPPPGNRPERENRASTKPGT